MENKKYSSDAPVSKIDDDEFSRWGFSERVAQVIADRQDPSSIVIGIYGAWGDGKTSVLNFIEQSLKSNENVICIKFNPWRFGSEDQLLMGFFNQIADALDSKLTTSGDKLKDIGSKVLKPVTKMANAEAVGEIVTSFISMPDIDEFKKRTERILESSEKRVLILIDDVDRLDKEEIYTLFRLVKLTADFKYTSYILAFDKDIVSSSLQDRYSNSQGNSGEAFLEKIIQVPLNLPHIDQLTLRKFCFKGIDEVLKLADIDLTEEQVQEFFSNYISAFDHHISTPRKAKLYSNTLMFSLPILKGEVNPIDLMLIEGVRLFYPKLYGFIKNNPDYFVGIYTSNSYGTDDKDHIKQQVDKNLESMPLTQRKGVIDLLKILFPKLQSVYGSMYYSGDSLKIWNTNQNICSKDYFYRYFGYSLLPNDVSDVDIEQLINKIANWREPYLTETNSLNKMLSSENADQVINKLRNRIDEVSQQTSKSLSIAIAQVSDKIPNSETFLMLSPYKQSAILIANLILNTDKADQINLAKLCFDNISEIEYQAELFRWLYHDKNENPKPNCFSSLERETLGKYLGQNIYTKIKDIDFTSKEPDLISRVFWILSEYFDKNILNDYVEIIINQDRTAIYRILNDYTPTFTSLTNGVISKESLNQASFKHLSETIDVSILYKAIIRLYPTLADVLENYPSLKNRDDDRHSIIIQQFMWWYRRDFSHLTFVYVSPLINLQLNHTPRLN